MGSDEANELGRFRRNIAGLPLADLAPVIALSLDELIDTLRRLGGGNLGIEMAAALAAELHKRAAAPVLRAARVGSA